MKSVKLSDVLAHLKAQKLKMEYYENIPGFDCDHPMWDEYERILDNVCHVHITFGIPEEVFHNL